MSASAIVPLRRILSAEDAGLYRSAADALRAAEATAAATHQMAARQAEAAYAERLAEADREAQAVRVRILAETSAAVQRTLAALPLEIAEAIAEGIAKVVGGLDLAEAVARAAQRAVAELAERHAAIVHVHPTAVTVTRARLGGGMRVVGDDGLEPDACVVETPSGTVRAGLTEQLASLRAAMIAAVAGDE
jgi:type III secretion protein L